MEMTSYKPFSKIADLLFLCFLLSSLAFRVHDFHTSITEMQVNPQSKKIEISIRLFTDDLETSLSKSSGKKISLEKGNQEALIKQYVEKHLLVKEKGKTMPLSFEGKETEGDATWFYFEMHSPNNLSDLTVQNDLLLEIFDDQVNILNTFRGKEKKSYLFSSKKTLHQLN